MKKFWLVFLNEYSRHVMRKRFLFALLSLPLVVVFLIGIGILSVMLLYNGKPIGYVDNARVLVNPLPLQKSDFILPQVEMRPYANEELALADLKANILQVVYVIPSDYLSGGKVRLVAMDRVSDSASSQFRGYLTLNVLAGQPADVRARLMTNPIVTIKASDGKRQMDNSRWFGLIAPLVAGFLFLLVINISGGYLLQALIEEKENRTIEIVVTSISPLQLMAGKIVGNICVGLTQLAAWFAIPIVGLLIAIPFLPKSISLAVDGSLMALTLALLLMAFVLVAALMAAVGATAVDPREAQQIAGLFTLPIMAPFWVITPLMLNPTGTLAVVLSLFPLTAPITMPLRVSFSVVPAWQIVLCLILMIVSTVAALVIAGRLFRLGMLRTGKRLSWKELFAKAG